MKSAIGEGMTRKDHADVSNQLVRSISFVSFEIARLYLVCELRYW